MQSIRRNGHWIVAVAGVFALGVSISGWIDRLPALRTAVAAPPQAVEGIAGAHELSAAFRHAAKTALPAVVSITTTSRTSTTRGQDSPDMDDLLNNSPFGDMLRNDPRMRDMFRGRSQRTPMPQRQGMGSGFIVEPNGVILTANHVVAGATQVRVKLHDGREYVATDIKTDPKTDVAMVRIKPEGALPTVQMGNSDNLEIGDWVLAIGSPFGLDATVTAGIISAKGRAVGINEGGGGREDFLQTDAAINPGNSGGPLINLRGEVIGINTAISTRSGGYDGVGFAVPINMAHWVADQLVAKGEVSRAYIGVQIYPIEDNLARHLKLPVGKGAMVTQVGADSPAAAAKLEAGDVILKFDSKDVHGTRDLQGIVERLKPGETYPMDILRDGKALTLQVTVREMPRDYALTKDALIPDTPAEASKADSFSDLGIEIEAAKAENLKQLGYKDDVQGVVITSVKDDSPAAEAHLREGLVITKVGSRLVKSPAEFREAMKNVSLEKGILMMVATPRGTQPVVVKGAAK